ncbi:RTXE polymerase, partial [Pseudoatta argentina]
IVGDRLRQLYTSCLRESIFPGSWKRARFVLLRKEGKPAESPSAYRLIYLLDDAGKLLERIIATRIVRHLSRDGPNLSHCQYGFREGLSTIDDIRQVRALSEQMIAGGYNYEKIIFANRVPIAEDEFRKLISNQGDPAIISRGKRSRNHPAQRQGCCEQALPKPYMITAKISPNDRRGKVDIYVIDAMIDSSSPISLQGVRTKIKFYPMTRWRLKNFRAKKSGPTFKINIVLKHDQLISARPRRLSFADREALQKILDELLRKKIIRPSNLPYANPIVLDTLGQYEYLRISFGLTNVYISAFWILFQKQMGYENPFFWNQWTIPTKAKYHSYELECLAVIYALKRFHIYLAEQKFKIITNCDSFHLTLNKKDINSRISRWTLFLQNYIYWFPKIREKVKKKEKLLFAIVLSPLEKTKKGYRHILLIIDTFTKFVRIYPCKSTTTDESINVCMMFGVDQKGKVNYLLRDALDAREYKVGNYVLNIETTPSINKKLLPKFKGPYVVKAVLDYDRYIVTDVDGS